MIFLNKSLIHHIYTTFHVEEKEIENILMLLVKSGIGVQKFTLNNNGHNMCDIYEKTKKKVEEDERKKREEEEQQLGLFKNPLLKEEKNAYDEQYHWQLNTKPSSNFEGGQIYCGSDLANNVKQSVAFSIKSKFKDVYDYQKKEQFLAQKKRVQW
eukprot:CAMPEP_0117423638 /NCGR_PEP_ID=MMETSP0758-20121206/4210_1 /TAXON_ID=63605 /ORGANISM="Percolomonas cosmopolitus, Strain AE-1 (ATCC 50343)" /LENGTH=154 /DNA_ID=CAMNT_0005206923 /DNA_START=192 /DNA_END=653 /DNA_ORIENTATION=+